MAEVFTAAVAVASMAAVMAGAAVPTVVVTVEAAAIMAVDPTAALTAARTAAGPGTEGRADTPPGAVPAQEGLGPPRAEAIETLRRDSTLSAPEAAPACPPLAGRECLLLAEQECRPLAVPTCLQRIPRASLMVIFTPLAVSTQQESHTLPSITSPATMLSSSERAAFTITVRVGTAAITVGTAAGAGMADGAGVGVVGAGVGEDAGAADGVGAGDGAWVGAPSGLGLRTTTVQLGTTTTQQITSPHNGMGAAADAAPV